MSFRGTHPRPLGVPVPVPGYRRPLAVALLFILALSSAASALAAKSDALEAIEVARGHLENLLSNVEASSETHRDGLSFRIDERAQKLGTMILNYPLSDSSEGDPAADLAPHLTWYQNLLIARYENLQQRIIEERQRFDEFDASAPAAISRAFQEDLRAASMRYAELMVKLPSFEERIGSADEEFRAEIHGALVLGAESLSGQVLLDATTLRELRNMLRTDPANTELQAAERAVQRKQVRNLNYLERIVRLMESADLDVTDYRALLLAERGTIGVELLRRDVFMSLLGSRINGIRDRLLAEGPNLVFRTVVFLALVALAWLVARLVQALVRSLVHRESVQLHRLVEGVIVSVSFGVVFAIGLVVALASIGISLVPMLAGLGVAGIIVGFALQDTLGNFASGWMILIYRPYDVDDHVIAGGVEGIVKRMNMVSTTIATFDNQRLVIPNSKIWGDVITNLTANRTRRVSIPVSVAFSEDLDRVEQVLREEIAAQEGVLAKPQPNVFVDNMGASEVVMMVHAWVRTSNYWTVLRSLTKRLKQRLDEEDMEIPYPQQDIYVRALPGLDPGKPADEAGPNT